MERPTCFGKHVYPSTRGRPSNYLTLALIGSLFLNGFIPYLPSIRCNCYITLNQNNKKNVSYRLYILLGFLILGFCGYTTIELMEYRVKRRHHEERKFELVANKADQEL